MEWNEVIQAKKVVTRIVGAGLGVNCLLHLQKERLSLITGEVGWLLVRRILEEDVLVAIVPHELLHILFLLISLVKTPEPRICKLIQLGNRINRVRQAIQTVVDRQTFIQAVRTECYCHEQGRKDNHRVAAHLEAPPLQHVLLSQLDKLAAL